MQGKSCFSFADTLFPGQISDAERSLARQVSAHLTANVKVQQLRDEAETLRAELETLAAQLMQQDEISASSIALLNCFCEQCLAAVVVFRAC